MDEHKRADTRKAILVLFVKYDTSFKAHCITLEKIHLHGKFLR